MSIGMNIRRIRKEHCIPQVRLAEMAGISKSAMCNIESGKENPSPSVIRAVADAFGCPVDALFRCAEGRVSNTPCEQSRSDCAAYQDGGCIALTSTDFPVRCPFYKTKAQAAAERKAALERLLAIGKIVPDKCEQ